MAKRVVVWTKTADIQFAGILEYCVQRNKSVAYSRKLIGLVADKTRQISETPFIFNATDFKDYRVATLGNFSIYFKVTDNQVIVTAFWDNRQNPEKLLKILTDRK